MKRFPIGFGVLERVYTHNVWPTDRNWKYYFKAEINALGYEMIKTNHYQSDIDEEGCIKFHVQGPLKLCPWSEDRIQTLAQILFLTLPFALAPTAPNQNP